MNIYLTINLYNDWEEKSTSKGFSCTNQHDITGIIIIRPTLLEMIVAWIKGRRGAGQKGEKCMSRNRCI